MRRLFQRGEPDASPDVHVGYTPLVDIICRAFLATRVRGGGPVACVTSWLATRRVPSPRVARGNGFTLVSLPRFFPHCRDSSYIGKKRVFVLHENVFFTHGNPDRARETMLTS